jgi:O-antigen/teichoic acid export membrane protein
MVLRAWRAEALVVAIDKLIAILPGPLRQLAQGLTDGNSERSRSQRGALTAFVIRVASAAIAFGSQVLLARWFGTYEFGIFTYVWIWINVVGTLCALGFATSVIRFIPEYRNCGQFGLALGFLRTGRTVAFATGTLVAVTGWGFLTAYGELVEPYYRMPLTIGLLCLPAFALTDFQDGVGRAQGWLDLALGPPYIFRPLLLLTLAAVAVTTGWSRDAGTVIQGAVVATWLTVIAQFLLQKKRMIKTLPSGEQQYRLPLWFKVSLPLLLLEGFTLMMTNLDILLLDLFVEPDDIAIYFAAARTIALISFVHFAITAVAMPKFAALAAVGDGTGLRRHLADMRAWTFWPSLAGAAGLLVLGQPLLWLFGPGFIAAYPVMFVLVGGLLALAAAGPVQGLLVVTGHQNITAGVLAVTVVVNGALNLALIPVWGLSGAAAATSLSLAFQALALHLAARRVTAGEGMAPATARVHGAAAE